MKNDLKTAENRPKEIAISKLRNRLRDIPLKRVGGSRFAGQYFSSLLGVPLWLVSHKIAMLFSKNIALSLNRGSSSCIFVTACI
jgi:hypothetical protein